jgi:tetratricopeptide (TPR) repeat protein
LCRVARGASGNCRLQRHHHGGEAAPNDLAIALTARAMAYKATGDSAKARADLDRAIAVKPDNALAYALRGGLTLHGGAPCRALPDLNRALELSPTFVGALVDRGKAYRKLGQLDLALTDLRAAMALLPSPESAAAWPDPRATFQEFYGWALGLGPHGRRSAIAEFQLATEEHAKTIAGGMRTGPGTAKVDCSMLVATGNQPRRLVITGTSASVAVDHVV